MKIHFFKNFKNVIILYFVTNILVEKEDTKRYICVTNPCLYMQI